MGISPISQVGSIGRVIGSTQFNLLFAHPLWHILKSRYCNGVNDSITLLLDVLLNFSKDLYPSSHGGELDTPNIINLMNDWIDLGNISKFNTTSLNLSFYEKKTESSSSTDKMTFDSHLLGLDTSFLHVTNNIAENNYFNLFQEKKVDSRVILTLDSLRKIRSVVEGVYVNSILINDFLEKITYSMIRFFQQPFRCKFCKQTYRRIPLSEKCPKCNNRTLEQTLSKGWVLRYFQIISHLSEKYNDNLSEYTKSWIKFIDSGII
jgi:DNA polymerase II large subunit